MKRAISFWFQASLTNCVHKKVFCSQENWQACERFVQFYWLLAPNVVRSTCPCDSGTSFELRCPVSCACMCIPTCRRTRWAHLLPRKSLFLLQTSDLHLEMALAMTPVSAHTSPGVRSVIQSYSGGFGVATSHCSRPSLPLNSRITQMLQWSWLLIRSLCRHAHTELCMCVSS